MFAQKFGDHWSGRDSRRWGDVVRVPVAAGPLDVTTEQIIQVEAPHPCVWRVMFAVSGFVAGDAATARFALDLGVGSMSATIETDAFPVPGTPPSGEFPAQMIVGRVRLQSAAVLADRNVAVRMWAAPIVPWVGLGTIELEQLAQMLSELAEQPEEIE